MSVRTSTQQPTSYTPTLSPNSKSIHERRLLHFFALHRMATATNILNALPEHFLYHNKVIRHLNWLCNKGYLIRQEDGDEYVYNITPLGYERCKDKEIGVDLAMVPYTYETPTGKRSKHEILITNTATSLYQCVSQGLPVQILKEWRFCLHNISVADPDTGEQLYPFANKYPDYMYLAKDSNGLMLRMLEAVHGVEAASDLKQMIREYELWEQTKAAQLFLTQLYSRFGAKEPKIEFQIHCILESSSWKHTDAHKERMTMMQTFQVSPKTQGRVWTTTKDAIETALGEGLSINVPIWHRGKDLMGEKRQRWQMAGKGMRTKLIDNFMRTLPTYPLFV